MQNSFPKKESQTTAIYLEWLSGQVAMWDEQQDALIIRKILCQTKQTHDAGTCAPSDTRTY